MTLTATGSRARAALVAVVAASCALGFLATFPQEAAAAIRVAGPELTRLLRGMALIKALIAAVAVAAVFWRLQFPATGWRAGAYVAACAAMAAGPGLVWNMAHVIAGAALLHTGLILVLLLGWRDDTVAQAMTRRIPSPAKPRQPDPNPAHPGIARV